MSTNTTTTTKTAETKLLPIELYVNMLPIDDVTRNWLVKNHKVDGKLTEKEWQKKIKI